MKWKFLISIFFANKFYRRKFVEIFFNFVYYVSSCVFFYLVSLWWLWTTFIVKKLRIIKKKKSIEALCLWFFLHLQYVWINELIKERISFSTFASFKKKLMQCRNYTIFFNISQSGIHLIVNSNVTFICHFLGFHWTSNARLQICFLRLNRTCVIEDQAYYFWYIFSVPGTSK